MPANSPIIKGLSTIKWSTGSTLGTPVAALVEGVRITPKNGDILDEIENNDGAGLAYVILEDGFSAQVTVTYDTALTWPAIGDKVALTLPKVGAAGGTTAHDCSVVSMPPELARKQAAKIQINLIHRPGVSLGA